MKISYIADPESIHTQRWLDYFVKAGHEVSLLNIRGMSKAKIPGVKEYSLKPICEDLTTKLHWRFFQFRRERKLKKIINRIKPDILHAHYASTNGRWAARSGFHPLVLTLWGSDIYKDAFYSASNRKMVTDILERADLITADSEDLRKTAVSLGAAPSKIQLVLFGVDTDRFCVLSNKDHVKKELGLTNCPVVLSTRSFKPFYNIDIIIKTIPMVVKEIPDVKFVFKKFEGEEDKKLMLLVKELGVEEYAIFVGRVNDHKQMVNFYNAADVFVSIPSWDGSSASLLEAMACGAVPVVSDFPSNLEWITDKVNGCVVPMRDEKKTAEAIIYLLKDPPVRKKYAELNRKTVEERADYYKHMKRMQELYYSLVGQHA